MEEYGCTREDVRMIVGPTRCVEEDGCAREDSKMIVGSTRRAFAVIESVRSLIVSVR